MNPKEEPNYQSQDVWSRTTTANGNSVDELRSVLQKSIRRGRVEEAALAAYETSPTTPKRKNSFGGDWRLSPPKTWASA
jgi:hypothetical protein